MVFKLIEGGVNIGLPLLFVVLIAIHICRHHRLSQIRGLLNLKDKCIWAKRVNDARRHINSISRLYRVAN
ncbi:hypothetical protein BDGGKGIB_00434 [Nodularia sphaerocarpa UHCC 0038]|nr:hypothetical protein BDGGKGIB_00434 [Nodularia sphaerocarpa UHCC 0038]